MPLTKRNVEVPLPCPTNPEITIDSLITNQTTQEQAFKKVLPLLSFFFIMIIILMMIQNIFLNISFILIYFFSYLL